MWNMNSMLFKKRFEHNKQPLYTNRVQSLLTKTANEPEMLLRAAVKYKFFVNKISRVIKCVFVM